MQDLVFDLGETCLNGDITDIELLVTSINDNRNGGGGVMVYVSEVVKPKSMRR